MPLYRRLALIALLLVPACSPPGNDEVVPSSVADKADAFAGVLLEGYNEADYEKFSRHFDAQLKRDLNPAVFHALRDSMVDLLGAYRARQLERVEQQGEYRVIHFLMRWDNEVGSEFKLVLKPYFDDYLISGIEFVGGSPQSDPPDSTTSP